MVSQEEVTQAIGRERGDAGDNVGICEKGRLILAYVSFHLNAI